MIKVAIFTTALLMSLLTYCQKFDLDPVRIVGSDEDEKYTFFKIMDVHIESDDGFLVLDRIRMKVTKYNSKGKFVKRAGGPGQGPGEYESINSICSDVEKYYVNSAISNKIIVYDKKLTYIREYKYEPQIMNILHVNEGGSMMTVNSFGNEFGHKRFVKIDRKGKLIYSFFDKCWWGDFRPKRDDYLRRIGFASVRGSYRNNKIIFGFYYCHEKTQLFVYTDKGKHLKTLEYQFKDKRYKLHMGHLSSGAFVKWFNKMEQKRDVYEIYLNNVFIYKNYYLVFIKYVQTHPGYSETQFNMFLVFNKDGKLVHEEDLCNDLDFFDMNDKGELIAADRDGEPVTVQIFQFKYSR